MIYSYNKVIEMSGSWEFREDPQTGSGKVEQRHISHLWTQGYIGYEEKQPPLGTAVQETVSLEWSQDFDKARSARKILEKLRMSENFQRAGQRFGRVRKG